MPHDPYRHLDYGRLIAWPQRLAREWPFLERAFAGIPVRHVLDLGAGPGQHARLFGSHGFAVTAVDASPAHLEEARTATAGMNVTLVAGDLTELDTLVAGPFGAVVCLGNTLPHVREDDTLARLARTVRALLPPGGVLVVQVLNYDRIFARPVRFLAPTFRPDPHDDGEIVFLRLLDPQPDGRTVVFTPSTLRHRATGEPPLEVTAVERVVQRGWRPDELDAAFDRAGFQTRTRYGTFAGDRFDALESPDLILVAR